MTRLAIFFERIYEAIEHLLAQKSSQQVSSLKTLILEETGAFDRRSNHYSYIERPVKMMDVFWRGTQETAMGGCRGWLQLKVFLLT